MSKEFILDAYGDCWIDITVFVFLIFCYGIQTSAIQVLISYNHVQIL